MAYYTLIHSTGTLIIEESALLPRTATDDLGNFIGIELDLPGRNFARYGQYYNQNLIDILENFSRYSTAPSRALKGQFWFDNLGTDLLLKSTGTVPLMKYNIGPLGTPNWVSLAANGNDVYFNYVDSENIDVRHTLTVYDKLTFDKFNYLDPNVGYNITINDPTEKDGYENKIETPATFSLLNEHVNVVNAFGNATVINIGNADSNNIIDGNRQNNTAQLQLQNLPDFIVGDKITIRSSDFSFNETYVIVTYIDETIIRYSNVGPDINAPIPLTGVVYYGKTNINNDLEIFGNIKIQGGFITTDSPNFKIFPYNVNTLDIGKNTEYINVGNSTLTGVTTFRHEVQIDNNLNIDSNTEDGKVYLSTNETQELELFNNNISTINAFGESHTINFGNTFSVNIIMAQRDWIDQNTSTVMLTTDQDHTFKAGDYVSIQCSDDSFNENFVELISEDTVGQVLYYISKKGVFGTYSEGESVTGTISYGVTNVKSDTLDVYGNIHIRGSGGILTNRSSFNILPDNATDIYIGASAENIELAKDSTTSVVTVNNDLQVDRNVNISGTDLTTDSLVFNLLDDTALTINFGGEATVLDIGSNTGFTRVNNELRVMGNLMVNGLTTYIDSMSMRIKDPLIELGNAEQVDNSSGGELLPEESLIQYDGRDRGLLLHYYDTVLSQATKAFIGWDVDHILKSAAGNVRGSYILSRDTSIDTFDNTTVNTYADLRLRNSYFNSSGFFGYKPEDNNPVAIEVGRTSNEDAYVNFISNDSLTSYKSSIIKNSGLNGSFNIINNDLGDLNIIQTLTGDVKFKSDAGKDRLFIQGSTGKIGANTITPTDKSLFTIVSDYATVNDTVSIALSLNNPNVYDGLRRYGVGLRFTHSSIDSGDTGLLADIHAISDSTTSPTTGGSLVFSTREGLNETTYPRSTIYSDGRMVIGELGNTNAVLTINKPIKGTSVAGHGILVNSLISNSINNATSSVAHSFVSKPTIESGSNTINKVMHYGVDSSVFKPVSSTTVVKNQYGYYVDGTMTQADNNYGFYSDLPSANNVWSFYARGTADSYFGGPTTIEVNSTKPALLIRQNALGIDAGDVLRVEDTSLDVSQNSDFSPFVIDRNGNVIIGHTNDNYIRGNLKVHNGGISVASWVASDYSEFNFYKSHGTTVGPSGNVPIGQMETVVNGEELAVISAYGVNNPSSGSKTFSKAASIVVKTASDIVTNNSPLVPGEIIFSTTSLLEDEIDGTIQPKERVTITAEGSVILGDRDTDIAQITYKNINHYNIRKLDKRDPTWSEAAGYVLDTIVDNDDLSNVAGFISTIRVDNNASLDTLTHFIAYGNNGDVTSQTAFRATENTASTNSAINVSFSSEIPYAANNYAFVSQHAKSFLNGEVGIKIQPRSDVALLVDGGIGGKQGPLISGGVISDMGFNFSVAGDHDTGMFSPRFAEDPTYYTPQADANGIVSFYSNGIEMVRIGPSRINNTLDVRPGTELGDIIVKRLVAKPGGSTFVGDWTFPSNVKLEGLSIGTGYRANQGEPNNSDSSTNGYAFGADGDTGMFSPIINRPPGLASDFRNNGVLGFYLNNVLAMLIQQDLSTGAPKGILYGDWELEDGRSLGSGGMQGNEVTTSLVIPVGNMVFVNSTDGGFGSAHSIPDGVLQNAYFDGQLVVSGQINANSVPSSDYEGNPITGYSGLVELRPYETLINGAAWHSNGLPTLRLHYPRLQFNDSGMNFDEYGNSLLNYGVWKVIGSSMNGGGGTSNMVTALVRIA